MVKHLHSILSNFVKPFHAKPCRRKSVFKAAETLCPSSCIIVFVNTSKIRRNAIPCQPPPKSQKFQFSLDLETSRASATTSALELAALGLDVGLLVLVGAHTEVLDSLTGVLWTADQQGVAASGGTQSQLVESQGLATGGENAAAGRSGESQSGDGHLGDLEKTVVVSNSADNDDSLALAVLVDLGLDAGEGDGRSVHLCE